MPTDMPNYLDKHKYVFGHNASTDTAKALGEQCLSQGRLYDAIDFFFRAGERGRVENIRKTAYDEGDFFLYRHTFVVFAEQPPTSELDALGDIAVQKGKYLFAKQAFTLTGNHSKLQLAEALINPPAIEENAAPAEIQQ